MPLLVRAYAWTAILLGLLLLLAAPAAAQTPSPLAYWQNDAGIVLKPLGGPLPEWSAVVGGGVDFQPLYEGSGRYRILPAPVFDIRYRDIAFLSTGEGLGVNLLRGKTYRAGIAISYNLGRSQHVTGRLNGIGNVSPAPEAKLFAEVALLPFVISADLRRGLGGYDGWIGDLGVYMPVVGNKKLAVFVGPAVTIADDRYMRSYFGIGPGQAAPHSSFPLYHATGGFKNVNFGLTAIYHFTDNWFLDADVSVERLLGSAANSPIVESRYQVGSTIILGYEF
jgi:outer membrane scaffolding protein for murein synthesis (MipA/OmpV family)